MGALSSETVGRIVQENFIATFEQVGAFRVTADKRGSGWNGRRLRLAKQGGNVVTYFCTPGGRVLHFTVGPVAADQLAADARFALDAHERIRPLEGDQRDAKLRDLHQRVFETPHDQPADAAKLRLTKQRLQYARMLLGDTKGKNRYGNPVPSPYYWVERFALNQQQQAHLLLSYVSPPLEEIERDVFENLADQPFRRRTSRNDELLAGVQRSLQDQRCVLLNITDQTRGSRSPSVEQLQRDPALIASVAENVDFIPLTQLELQALWDDLGHGPPPSYQGRKFAYVVLAPGVEPVWRSSGSTSAELVALLRTAVGQARPDGPVAETTAQRKFTLAKNLVEHNPTAAARRCRQIIDQHPQTKTALLARMLIAELE